MLLLIGCSSEEPPIPRMPLPTCPARMVHLPSLDACIDRYEAVVEEVAGRAVARSIEGRIPTQEISWFAAGRACRSAGYRLCSRDEWMQACAGTTGEGGRGFPYGDEYEHERCNSARDGTSAADRSLAATGTFERCVTPEGVYDLSGNLGEWIDASDQSGVLREVRGGSFSNYEKPAHCVTAPLAFQPPQEAWSGLGFRCCADAR